jgi:hypothetical protein
MVRSRHGCGLPSPRNSHIDPPADSTRQEVFVPDVKLGALCWNQYTSWPDLLEAGTRADRLGYDTLWT